MILIGFEFRLLLLKKCPTSLGIPAYLAGEVAYLCSTMKGCPALTKPEINLAMRNLRGRWRWRNRALLVLGIHTGLRISEALSLRLAQVYQGGQVLPRLYLHRQDSKGKRTGSSIVIHPRAAAALLKWIQSPLGPTQPDDPLFPSQRYADRPMDRHTGWLTLHRAFIAAGVVGMCGSHAMRKTFCASVNLALRGDIFRLSKAMRHTSVFTTLAYMSYKQEEIDRAILRG
jgi:integrase